MRVALLGWGREIGEPEVASLEQLAKALAREGIHTERVAPGTSGGAGDARVLQGVMRAADELLKRRGFDVPLAHVPASAAVLLAGRYDLVHAFSVTDAVAARWWRQATRRPIAFTCVEVLNRATLADRRLRRSFLTRALEAGSPVLAATPAAQAALHHWMAVDASVLELRDAAGHVRLYRSLIACRP